MIPPAPPLPGLALALALASCASSLAAQAPAPVAPREAVLPTEGGGPAILYDGREISREDLTGLDASALGDIRILDGAQAAAAYGGRYATHGVIVVTTSVPEPAVEAAADAPPAPAEEVTLTLADLGGRYVVIDDAPADAAALRALAPEAVGAIEVLEPAAAVARFGEEAASGAVVVTTADP